MPDRTTARHRLARKRSRTAAEKRNGSQSAAGASPTDAASAGGSAQTGHLDELGGLVGYNLRLAYNRQVQRFSVVGGSFNIRPAQFAILLLAHQRPGIRQMELTRALQKKHANIVTLLDELERRDLIERALDPSDKRSRLLRLTPDGERLIRKLLARHARLERNLEETFGRAQRAELLKLLEAFRRLDPDPDIDDPDD